MAPFLPECQVKLFLIHLFLIPIFATLEVALNGPEYWRRMLRNGWRRLDRNSQKTIDFNPEITSEASNTDDFTFIIPQFDQDSSISGIIIRQFSDKEGYIAFGKSMDAEFEDYVNFRDVVINYAIQNGVIAEYESTETVPTSFVTWYETELNTTFNAPTLFPVTVYKDYKGGPAWMHPLGYAFFMAPGWNNKVSRYMHLTAITYGWMFIYDKAFFKKHLALYAILGGSMSISPGH